MNTKKIIGAGLVALDIILNENRKTEPSIIAGGSCGNVLSILAFLKWESYPIARLDNSEAASLIIEDLLRNDVNTSLISRKPDGSTPIIIHRILTDKYGNPKHRFEFKSPKTGKWFPNFKPVLNKSVGEIINKLPKADVYYFDRLSRSTVELAKIVKKQGAIIFFEPSSIGNEKLFTEAIELADIIKFSDERISQYRSLFPKSQATLEIMTKGADGLDFRFKSNDWTSLESIKINNLVDAAGAGDWTSAGIIYRLSDKNINTISKESIVESLQYGQLLGAINCQFIGARGTMDFFSYKQLMKLISEINNIKADHNLIHNINQSRDNIITDKKEDGILTSDFLKELF